jgi:hypothetical protein
MKELARWQLAAGLYLLSSLLKKKKKKMLPLNRTESVTCTSEISSSKLGLDAVHLD